MNIIKITEAHLNACLAIAIMQYSKECDSVEVLYEEDYDKELLQRLKIPCKKGNGIVCLEENHVCGYLIAETSIEDKLDYISVPVWGYGVEGGNRRKIISLLFQNFADMIMKLNCKVNFNVKLYAHDSEIISYFSFCQFGILCTDAVRSTSDMIYPVYRVKCKELSKKEIINRKADILKLFHRLIHHLQKSPVFYPGIEFTDEVYMQYILCNTTRMFAAFEGDEIIGIIDASIDKECFILNNDMIYNVGDIYIDEAYRGKLVAQSLLNFVNNTFSVLSLSK
jgi:hypothetical protein